MKRSIVTEILHSRAKFWLWLTWICSRTTLNPISEGVNLIRHPWISLWLNEAVNEAWCPKTSWSPAAYSTIATHFLFPSRDHIFSLIPSLLPFFLWLIYTLSALSPNSCYDSLPSSHWSVAGLKKNWYGFTKFKIPCQVFPEKNTCFQVRSYAAKVIFLNPSCVVLSSCDL